MEQQRAQMEAKAAQYMATIVKPDQNGAMQVNGRPNGAEKSKENTFKLNNKPIHRPMTARTVQRVERDKWDIEAAIKKTAPNKASDINKGKDLNFLKKKESRTMADIEKDLWKNNITFTPRKKVDVLDISKEDFR